MLGAVRTADVPLLDCSACVLRRDAEMFGEGFDVQAGHREGNPSLFYMGWSSHDPRYTSFSSCTAWSPVQLGNSSMRGVVGEVLLGSSLADAMVVNRPVAGECKTAFPHLQNSANWFKFSDFEIQCPADASVPGRKPPITERYAWSSCCLCCCLQGWTLFSVGSLTGKEYDRQRTWT